MKPFCLLLITLLGNGVFFFWTHPENLFKKSCKDPYVLRVKLYSITVWKILYLLLFTATNSSILCHSDSGIVLYHFLNAVAWGGGFCIHQIHTKAISYLLMCLAKDKCKVSYRHILLAQKCYSKQFFNLVWPQKDKWTAKCLYCFYFQKSVCQFHQVSVQSHVPIHLTEINMLSKIICV